MTVTVSMPVFLRVGDGKERPIGSVQADSPGDLQQGVADLLRTAATALEEQADSPAGTGLGGDG